MSNFKMFVGMLFSLFPTFIKCLPFFDFSHPIGGSNF